MFLDNKRISIYTADTICTAMMQSDGYTVCRLFGTVSNKKLSAKTNH
jgi:hypothetical protein